MLTWLKLSHHHYSGKLRPHEHTSYALLGIILLIAGVFLSMFTVSAAHPPPQDGSVSLTGTMPATPPTTAAVITSPADQAHFTITPVGISGTCPADTLVELFKNDIFAGSTVCSSAGVFTVDIDLMIGSNKLVARVYDALNQAGPDSSTTTIYYDALPAQAEALTSLNFGTPQLILKTDAVFRGAFPQKEMNVPIEILGGTPPYAINVLWGDSDNKVVPRNDNSAFTVSHAYVKAGTYQLSIQATDAASRVAFLTVAAIINGQPEVVASSSSVAGATTNQLLILWPLYAATFAVVVSFWIGERREKHVLKARGLLVS